MPDFIKGGPIVWVTGGASGIGRATAQAFARANATVIATDIRVGDQSESYREIACNVTSRGEIARVIEALEELGGVDILVNCAGVLKRMDVMDITPEIWDATMAVNVKGAFLCSQAAAASMKAREKKGFIINIGSVNNEIFAASAVHYCSSKAALHSMTRAMAVALGPFGIRVNTVAPGAIPTELEATRWQDPESFAYIRSVTPLRSVGTAHDIASAILFLSSESSQFTSGATLYIDGGRTASI